MRPTPSILVAIPAHNEERSVDRVLPRVLQFNLPVLVIDDGSTDSTAARAASWPVQLVRNAKNVGYGRVMQDVLAWSAMRDFDWVITMDCDEQHEPEFLPEFIRAIMIDDADVISGSRYLRRHQNDQDAPADRREVNRTLTAELNAQLDGAFASPLTDSFCGFKAYRTRACNALRLDANGYEFPMQFWVQAAANRLRVREIAVPRIYLDASRSFGNGLDDPERRLQVYRATLHRELSRCRGRLSYLHRAACACALCATAS
ncbi:MAG: glycosyltransferase family 2 protein [Phycisphaerales bacterium]|nr:glycosyltransferase family 2 protein [Phycisphaerales bacterium]